MGIVSGLHCTERDRALIRCLTHKVPFLSLAQCSRAFWMGRSQNAARKRLYELVRHGYLWKATVPIHPELPLKAPVYSWAPGDGAPSFGAIAHELHKRWSGVPQPTTIFRATETTADRMGGHGGRLPHEVSHLDHDLHLGTMFLAMSAERQGRWMSEREVKRLRRGKGRKVPDAALRPQSGGDEMVLLLEMAGAYDKRHLISFYEGNEGLPFEWW